MAGDLGGMGAGAGEAEQLLRYFARLVAIELRSEGALTGAQASGSAGTGGGYVDQKQSPLGSRRHRAAVERRLASGEGGAFRLGRRFLLTSAAVVDELRGTTPPVPASGGVANDGHPTRLRKAKPRPSDPDPELERLERDIRNGLGQLARDD